MGLYGGGIAAFRARQAAMAANALEWVWRPDSSPVALTTSASAVRTFIDADGVVQPAASGAVRDADYSTGERGMLVESARTNLLISSADLSAAAAGWGGAGDFTINPSASIIEGGTAWKHTNLGAVGFRSRFQSAGVWTTGERVVAQIVVENVSGADLNFGLQDQTASSWVAFAVWNWTSKTLTESASTPGAAPTYRARDLGNGRWLLTIAATGVTSGNARRVLVYPTGTSQNTNAATIHLVGIEAGAFATSYIPTTGAAATRAADAIVAAGVLRAGIHATRYERYYDLATQAVVEQVVDVPATGTDVMFDVDRVWYALAYAEGVKTLAEMQAIVYPGG